MIRAVILTFAVSTPAMAQGLYLKNLPPQLGGAAVSQPAALVMIPNGELHLEGRAFRAKDGLTDGGTYSKADGTDFTLRGASPLNASVWLGLMARSYTRYVDSRAPGFESSSAQAQTEVGPAVAFKILDTIAFGLSAEWQKRRRNPGSTESAAEKSREYSIGTLYKTDLTALGFYRKTVSFSEDGDVFHEYGLTYRRALGPASAFLSGITKDPQDSCCDVSAANRWQGMLGIEHFGERVRQEWTVTHRPAYEAGMDASVARTILAARIESMSSKESPWGFGAGITYGFGTGKIRGESRRYERAEGSMWLDTRFL